ncbi:MAG: ABC transporter permease [Microbacterium sp.]
MIVYVAKRLAQGVLTVALTVSAVFVLVRLAPGDPARTYAGPIATAEQVEEVRRQFGLDQPIAIQYVRFIGDLLRGDLGTSFSFQSPAVDVVMERLPYTMTLAIAAILVTIVVAIPLGVWMSRRADTRRELVADVGVIAGQSMPEFWTGTMLITVFAVLIPILPASGFATWSALALPTVTIAIMQIALISRMVRREMVGNLAMQYVVGARSRGVSSGALTWRYAFGNAAVPVLTALGTRFAAMLNGVVVVEVVFAWPGVGSLVVRALETRDYPLIVTTVLVTSILAVLVQLLVDLIYPLLDPRVRLGKAS